MQLVGVVELRAQLGSMYGSADATALELVRMSLNSKTATQPSVPPAKDVSVDAKPLEVVNSQELA